MVRKNKLQRALLLSLLGVPLALVGGCSLTSLVDVRVGECSGDNEEGHRRCQEILNPKYGFYEGCAAFKCVELDDYFQCQMVEDEVCDGEDNDCDYLIDEPSDRGTLLKTQASDLVSGIERAQTLSLAESEEFGRSLYLQENDDSLVQVALDGDGSTSTPVELRTQKPISNVGSKASFVELTDGCYTAPNGAVGNCRTSQAVATAGANVGFFAYVNTQGCSAGELRVGVMEQSHPEEFVDRGLATRDPTYRGVHTQGTRCSSNLEEACESLKGADDPSSEDLSAACGISSPTLAALSADEGKDGKLDDQALVAYLGLKASNPECSKEPTNLLSLLVHSSTGTFDKSFHWSNPSQDGVPEILGKTKSGSPPSVITLDDRGFLVTHGNAEGGIRLVWVPRQAPPDKVLGVSCPSDDCSSRDGVETEPLKNVEEVSVLKAKGTSLADAISVTQLRLNDDQIALLLTWVDGCARKNVTLGLEAKAQLLVLNLSEKVPAVEKEFDVVSLGPVLEAPLATASTSPFVVSGFERNDEEATDHNNGGFLVFVPSHAPHVLRLAAFDGQPVVGEEEIEAESWSYLLALGPDSVAAHDEESGKLKAVTVACGE